MSSLCICIIAWICSSVRMSLDMFAGTICQLRLNLSLHQPHCSDSGTCDSAFQ